MGWRMGAQKVRWLQERHRGAASLCYEGRVRRLVLALGTARVAIDLASSPHLVSGGLASASSAYTFVKSIERVPAVPVAVALGELQTTPPLSSTVPLTSCTPKRQRSSPPEAVSWKLRPRSGTDVLPSDGPEDGEIIDVDWTTVAATENIGDVNPFLRGSSR